MDEKQFNELVASIKQLSKKFGALEKRVNALEPASQHIQEKPVAQQKKFEKSASEEFSIDWKKIELGLGRYGLQVLGIILFLIGMVFFFKYAIERNWVSPIVRIIAGLSAATILLIIGQYFHKRYQKWALGCVAGGIILMFISWYSAHLLYDLITVPQALVAVLLTTIVGCVLALRHNSYLLTMLCMIGGFLAPIGLGAAHFDGILLILRSAANLQMLMPYLMVLSAGFVVLGIIKRWMVPVLFSLFFLACFHLGLGATDLTFTEYLVVYLIILCIYNIFPLVYLARKKIGTTAYDSTIESVSIALGSIFAFVGIWSLVVDGYYRYHQYLQTYSLYDWLNLEQLTNLQIFQYLCLKFALFFMLELGLLFVFARKTNKTLMFLMLAFFTGFCGFFEFPYNVCALALYSIILLLLARIYAQQILCIAAYAVSGIAIIAFWFGHDTFVSVIGSDYLPLIILFFVIAALLTQHKKSYDLIYALNAQIREIALLLGIVFVFLAGREYVLEHFSAFFLTFYYGSTALILLIGALVNRKKLIHYFGIFVVALTLFELWYLVIAMNNTLNRVIAFIIIGLAFVVASFIYQRLSKKLE